MRQLWTLLCLLALTLPTPGCSVDDDDDSSVGDDDDTTGDDDDATGDDDDTTGDDDDTTGDDDDTTGDDDDTTGDDDDSSGDDDDSAGDDDDSTPPVDADGDGVSADLDCDDADPDNYPGNTEVCDDADNDCDGATFATGEDTDVDADGVITCLDCDDADATAFPGNSEVCDTIDNDCDSSTFAVGEDTDVDSDGVVTCLDCDDADAGNFPGNTEVCDDADNDCDSSTFATGEDTDADGDSVITCLDCDDADAANFPGNAEVCDGGDNDCDAATVFTGEDTDSDSDGSIACLDCDDADGTAYPGNTEVCDGIDNDCDASTVFTDEDVDADADGSPLCEDCDDAEPTNFPGNAEVCDGEDNDCDAANVFTGEDTDSDSDGTIACLDCDDADDAAFPGNPEVCDGVDNDCDATTFATDEGTDSDSDGSPLCLDCDDLDGSNFPSNPEVCDGQDNDCSGTTLEEWTYSSNGSSFSGTNRFRGNRFFVSDSVLLEEFSLQLNAAAGTTITFGVWVSAQDEDDFELVASNDVVISATDGGALNDISSGTFDVQMEAGLYYCLLAWWGGDSVGYIANSSNPSDPSWGSAEGSAWGSSSSFPTTVTDSLAAWGGYYDGSVSVDLEGDGDADSSPVCDDCDDADAAIFPGATELCDGIDNDCDATTVFTGEDTDADSDGEVTCLDCDDADPLSYTGAPELCDGLDNDCNAVVDDFIESTQFTVPSLSVGPDSGTVTTSTITMSTSGAIADINIAMDLNHGDFAELEIDITSPSGTTVRLQDPSQFTTARGNSAAVVFDDEGNWASVEAAPAADMMVIPYELLEAFDGEELSGTWTLTVTDTVDSTSGTLESWAVDAFPEGYGDQMECPAENCALISQLDVEAPDGDYWLESLSGAVSQYECNGGWTKVVSFDRENDADGITEFEANWDSFVNTMGLYQEATSSLQYQDANFSEDALYGVTTNMVANYGDVQYDIHFEGTSMEDSGVWFWVESAAGASELWCNDDATGASGYSSTELGYIPLTCSEPVQSDPTFDGADDISVGAQVTSVGFLGLMSDQNGGDDAQLYRYEVWVQ